jgi:ABC-type sugar transport system substrate-binding protein
MQQRIAGFVCKVKFDFPEMNILRTLPIPSGTKQELFDNIYNCTAELLRSYPSANSLYIPCGLFDYAAAAVKDTGRSGEVTVIGHEYTASLHDYLKNKIVGATIYQHPAQQWYAAINKLYNILASSQKIEYKDYVVECSILMEETISSAKIGNLDIL